MKKDALALKKEAKDIRAQYAALRKKGVTSGPDLEALEERYKQIEQIIADAQENAAKTISETRPSEPDGTEAAHTQVEEKIQPDATQAIGRTVQETIVEPSVESVQAVLEFSDDRDKTEHSIGQHQGEAQADVVQEWEVGDVILDQYDVKKVLGKGSFGKAFLVHDRSWDMDLAVKCPLPDAFKKDIDRANFVRECHAWMDLGLHNHIVVCHYVRVLGGTPRVFMEYVDGGSLKDLINEGRGSLYADGPEKTLERILDIAIQFAWGLHYAHEKGLVHKDIKPANVMMTSDGTVKLVDFGMANALASGSESGKPPEGHSVLASYGGLTPAYCSPEQAENATRRAAGMPTDRLTKLTRQTDIYSWAVTVFEMFTGEVTWPSGNVVSHYLESYLEEDPSKSGSLAIPDGIATVLRRCLEQDPTARPDSMLEVSEELKHAYREATGRDYPNDSPAAPTELANILSNKAISFLELGKSQIAKSMWEKSHQLNPNALISEYNYLLNKWRSAQTDDLSLIRNAKRLVLDVKEGERYLNSLFRINLERGDYHAAHQIYRENKSPNRWIQSLDRETAMSFGRSTNFVPRVVTQPSPVVSMSFSANGDKIYLALDGRPEIHIIDSTTGQSSGRLDGIPYGVMGLSNVMSDGIMVSGSILATAHVWDTTSGRCLATYSGHTDCVSCSCLFPNGSIAATGSYDKTVQVWRTKSTDRLLELRGHQNPVGCVDVSADGCLLASTGTSDCETRIWDAKSGSLVSIIQEPCQSAISCHFLPSCRHILVGSADRMVRLYETDSGKCVGTFHGHDDAVYSLSVFPDCQHFVSTDKKGQARIWQLSSGRCLRTFSEVDGLFSAISNDGSKLALGGQAGVLYIEDIMNLSKRELALYEFTKPESTSELVTDEKVFRKELAGFQTALKLGSSGEALTHYKQIQKLKHWADSPEFLQGIEQHPKLFARRGLKGSVKLHTLADHDTVTAALAVSPGDMNVITGDDNGCIRLWDGQSGNLIQKVRHHTREVRSLSIVSESLQLVSGDWGGVLNFQDLSADRLIRSFDVPGSANGASVVCLSVDKTRGVLNAGVDNLVVEFDLQQVKPQRIFSYHQDFVTAVRFSPDYTRFASSSNDGRIGIWSRESGKIIGVCHGHVGKVMALQWHPAGKHLVSSGSDGTVRVWDVSNTKCIKVFKCECREVRALGLSPCGRFVLAGGNMPTVEVWDIIESERIANITTNAQELWAMEISSGGTQIVTALSGNTVVVERLDWVFAENNGEFSTPERDGFWARRLRRRRPKLHH